MPAVVRRADLDAGGPQMICRRGSENTPTTPRPHVGQTKDGRTRALLCDAEHATPDLSIPVWRLTRRDLHP